VLAFIYDDDNSHSLDDTEKAKLQADLAAGCTARNAALLSTFDADGSGDLNQAEWDAAVAADKAAHDAQFAAIDTDGDGRISPTEMDAARAAFLATWDSNGNGTLDDDELATLRAAMQQLVRSGEELPFIPPPPPPSTTSTGSTSGP
jgi:hypothetical protein